MVFFPHNRLAQGTVAALARTRMLLNAYDLAAFTIIAALIVLVAHGSIGMRASLEALSISPVSLDIAQLPEYALRTTLRMFAAILASLIFAFTVATLAAKSRRAELIIIPSLDILQSVPVLGFLTFTVAFFMNLFPGSQLGAECASIFAIFTSQAWNMAFSFYQSLKTVPRDLDEVCRGFRLSTWQRFWRLEAPFAAPGLIWNTMMSMSGGWFFVVASEAITVGDTTVQLPGIGSWLALAIQEKDFAAIGWAVLAMATIIVLYDQLLFRPIVTWADKFRFEQTAASEKPRSWVYGLIRRTRVMKGLAAPFSWAWQRILLIHIGQRGAQIQAPTDRKTRLFDCLWVALVLAVAAWGAWTAVDYVRQTLSWSDALEALGGRDRDAGAGGDPHRRGEPDLGPGRRMDRSAPGGRRTRAAAGAVPGRFPSQRALPFRRNGDRGDRSKPEHLALAADGVGHPMVHPVQRHRRGERLPDRPTGGGGDVPPTVMDLVA